MPDLCSYCNRVLVDPGPICAGCEMLYSVGMDVCPRCGRSVPRNDVFNCDWCGMLVCVECANHEHDWNDSCSNSEDA